MDMRENKRLLTSFILLAIMLVLLFVLNVANGSRAVAIADIPAILMGSGGGTAHSIIWSIRLPRIVTAMILGGALAVSGFLLQTFFNNPIAGPFILGISSGSKLAVALVMIFSLGAGMHLGSFAMVLAAYRFYSCRVTAGTSHECADHMRSHGRLHMLSDNGDCRHLRG